jgi:hypothetical protein
MKRRRGWRANSENSAGVANRSAGSFSSAVITAASTWRGMVWRWGSIGRGVSVTTRATTALRRARRERRVAGQQLVEDRAQGVDVRAGGDLALAHRLLGAHIVRCTERHAGLGHPGPAGLAGGERDAEVGHERLAVVEQDVLGLDVVVDHPVPVGVEVVRRLTE